MEVLFSFKMVPQTIAVGIVRGKHDDLISPK